MELLENEAEEDPNTPCGICGQPHDCSDCSLVKFQHHISDNPVPSKARLSLPDNLRIEPMAEGSFSVLAKDAIEEGTRFGPFEAKKVFTLEPQIQFPLKVFPGTDYFKEYYLDNSNEFDCNWMYFVQPASTFEEQNLICYEDKCNVFYISVRGIESGEHLKVWYGEYYASKMDKDVLKPVAVVENVYNENNVDVNELVKNQQRLRDRKLWICKFCGKQDYEVTDFAVHVLDHYRLQLRKTCEICKENFQTRRSLKRHMFMSHSDNVLLHHTKLDLAKKTENNKVNATKAGGKSDVLGGPLLNEIVSDSFENTNVLLEHMMLPNFDMDQTNVMLENENLHLGVDGLLNDNENFNFNLEETSDKFVCDICLKNFTKLRYLVQHLVCHTGKFTCKRCLKVFSRKENFVAHICMKTPTFKCDHCDFTFSLKKNLTRHVIVKHKLPYVCGKDCKRVFPSKTSLDDHKCVPEKNLSCGVCGKQYSCMRNLNRHKIMHNAKAPSSTMCEICSKQLASTKQLRQHMKTHANSPFACKLCGKRFSRETARADHMKLHDNCETHICPDCGQKFPLKKYLNSHMMSHKNKFKHNCSECVQKFRQRSNLQTHFNRVHRKMCQICNTEFDSAEKLKQHNVLHYEKCYECPVCKHVVKLRSSLLRHLKKQHSQVSVDPTSILERRISNDNAENVDNNNIDVHSNCDDIVNLLNLKEKDDTDMQDIDSNLDYIVNNYDPNTFNVESSKGNNKQMEETVLDFNSLEMDNESNNKSSDKHLEDAVIDFNSLEMDFEQNFNMQPDANVASQEVCLSMPELTDIEQNITLGENAYILENGTIIEPIEQGKVVLYILDKDQKS